jgi:tellurite resistance protein
MATKADFTEDEFETIQRGVSGAGMLVSLADRDFTDSFGEAKALAKYLSGQRDQSQSTLMRDVANLHSSKFGFGTSATELEEGTLGSLRSAVAAIEAKAPDEAPAYRAMVLGVAKTVADAKGGGTSPAEETAIEKISDALGTTYGGDPPSGDAA